MRTHYNSEINELLINKVVIICGWVNRRRDHGGLIFLDIRDRTGVLQLVCEPQNSVVFRKAYDVRHEYVIRAKGMVRPRPKGQENNNLATGKIEIVGQSLELINRAKTIPFELDSNKNISEDTRLKYRYIDLRRPESQNRLVQRSHISHFVRQYLHKHGFLDIETPLLSKATLEGAREYLVPSRNDDNNFYALPQSPQLFKQLLMISGFDRYYQIVKCFRDEDLRADRQPEFTQIDIEASFVNENILMGIVEKMIYGLFKQTGNKNFPNHFPVISYARSIEMYGTDKPDLRIPLHFVDIKDAVRNEKLEIFSKPANEQGSRVVAMRITNGVKLLTRKMLDNYNKFVIGHNISGLFYIKVKEWNRGRYGLQSSLVKHLSDQTLVKIMELTNAKDGDLILFCSGKEENVNISMGALRIKIGQKLKLYTQEWSPLWIIDFPMFKKSSDKLYALHHPFTAPKIDSIHELVSSPETVLSRAYDMVINGYEVGGGSIRIHDQKVQEVVFELLGIKREKMKKDFKFFLEALRYGTPVHGGIAFGLDRLAMLATHTDNVRDVIAFPKTYTANCLMTGAPTLISNKNHSED